MEHDKVRASQIIDATILLMGIPGRHVELQREGDRIFIGTLGPMMAIMATPMAEELPAPRPYTLGIYPDYKKTLGPLCHFSWNTAGEFLIEVFEPGKWQEEILAMFEFHQADMREAAAGMLATPPMGSA